MEHKEKSIIEIRNFSKSYKDRKVFNEFNWQMFEGEIVGLLGPNGAGKSTLIESITGIRPVQKGDIKVLGKDLKYDRKDIMKNVGIQTQEFAFQPKARVKEIIQFFSTLYNDAIEIDRLIKELQLENVKNTSFSKLSGGQKKRVSLAKAIIGNPELIILDEPTSGLDPHGHSFLIEMIEKIRYESKALLISTHDMKDAERLCDTVMILDKGEILDEGNPFDLIKKYCSTHCLRIPNYSQKMKEDLVKEIETSVKVDRLFLSTNYLNIYFTDWEVVKNYVDTKLENFQENYKIESPTLEDVFLVLTGRELRD